jgi:type IV secretory pathway component VirB8
MNDEERQASEMMRQGSYYQQSRQWFQTLYIAPIAERSFYLLISILAGLIAVAAFMAVIGFLPVTDRPAIMIANERIDTTMPVITRLREGDTNLNAALRDFYLKRYVEAREGYTVQSFLANSLFVTAHSDESTQAAYAAAVGPDNPRNPAALLGEYGRRTVTIASVSVRSVGNESVPSVATVRFSTELSGIGVISKTEWTATIGYYYSDAVVSEVTDPDTGQERAELEEPTFQVVNYAIAETR